MTETRNIERPTFAPDIEAELANPKYSTLRHYSLATYNLGCHGPMCKLAEKERGRKRTQKKAEKNYREIRVNYNRNDSRNEELIRAIAWHWQDLIIRRERYKKDRAARNIERKITQLELKLKELVNSMEE